MTNRTRYTITTIAVTFAITTPFAQASTLRADRATTRLAVSIVANAEHANRALASGKSVDANMYIERALSEQTKMAQIVRTDGTSTIVPIFTELDDTATLAKALKTSTASKARARSGTLVRRNAVEVTSVAIDVTKARVRLDEARRALAEHDTQAAEYALAAVGSDLVVASVAANVPLLTAREDLSLAQRALDRNQPTIATADLRQASTALGRYNSAAHSNDVHKLASTIDAEAPHAHGGHAASAKIDAWWTSLERWFSPHA